MRDFDRGFTSGMIFASCAIALSFWIGHEVGQLERERQFGASAEASADQAGIAGAIAEFSALVEADERDRANLARPLTSDELAAEVDAIIESSTVHATHNHVAPEDDRRFHGWGSATVYKDSLVRRSRLRKRMGRRQTEGRRHRT